MSTFTDSFNGDMGPEWQPHPLALRAPDGPEGRSEVWLSFDNEAEARRKLAEYVLDPHFVRGRIAMLAEDAWYAAFTILWSGTTEGARIDALRTDLPFRTEGKK